jgi:hypothetical protein
VEGDVLHGEKVGYQGEACGVLVQVEANARKIVVLRWPAEAEMFADTAASEEAVECDPLELGGPKEQQVLPALFALSIPDVLRHREWLEGEALLQQGTVGGDVLQVVVPEQSAVHRYPPACAAYLHEWFRLGRALLRICA